MSKNRTYRTSNPGMAGAKQTNTTLAYNIVLDVNHLHAVGVRNTTGADVYLMVFDADELPANGTAPDLPPELIPDGMTTWIDFGGAACPMDNIVAAISSSDNTLTIHGTAFRITVTHA